LSAPRSVAAQQRIARRMQNPVIERRRCLSRAVLSVETCVPRWSTRQNVQPQMDADERRFGQGFTQGQPSMELSTDCRPQSSPLDSAIICVHLRLSAVLNQPRGNAQGDHGVIEVHGRRIECGQKKPRRNAVANSSFELLGNRWNPIRCFRLPVKACRPPRKSRLRNTQLTVQGLSFWSRAWQGKLLPHWQRTVRRFGRERGGLSQRFPESQGQRPEFRRWDDDSVLFGRNILFGWHDPCSVGSAVAARRGAGLSSGNFPAAMGMIT